MNTPIDHSYMRDRRRQALIESHLLRVQLWHPHLTPALQRGTATRLAANKGPAHRRAQHRKRMAAHRARKHNTLQYPLAPVARYCPDRRLSVRGLKAVTGLGWQRCQTWIRNGHVTESVADEIACAIGVHPSEIWPEWWDNAA